MKNPSGEYTYVRTTSPECFRAVATGVGNTIGQSKMTGEVRKAIVRSRPGTIAMAPSNEGFGPETGAYGREGKWYGTHGDMDAAMQPGAFPPNSSR